MLNITVRKVYKRQKIFITLIAQIFQFILIYTTVAIDCLLETDKVAAVFLTYSVEQHA